MIQPAFMLLLPFFLARDCLCGLNSHFVHPGVAAARAGPDRIQPQCWRFVIVGGGRTVGDQASCHFIRPAVTVSLLLLPARGNGRRLSWSLLAHVLRLMLLLLSLPIRWAPGTTPVASMISYVS